MLRKITPNWGVGGCIFWCARGPRPGPGPGSRGPGLALEPGSPRAHQKNAATKPSIRGDFSQHWEIFLNIEKNNADHALKLSIKGILRLTRHSQHWGFLWFVACIYSSRKNPIKETPIQETPRELYDKLTIKNIKSHTNVKISARSIYLGLTVGWILNIVWFSICYTLFIDI